MQLWRKRLSDLTSSFARASEQKPPQGDEPPALRSLIASTSGQDDSQEAHNLRKQVTQLAGIYALLHVCIPRTVSCTKRVSCATVVMIVSVQPVDDNLWVMQQLKFAPCPSAHVQSICG